MPEPYDLDEIACKAVYWDSSTVNARLRDSFKGTEYPAAALLLAGLAPAPECGEEADEAACRLMLAALRVSDGSLAKLKMWIDVARMDPRDLIGAAEYRRELELSTEQARADDLADYLAWARGTD
jgi:hypothetical protein